MKRYAFLALATALTWLPIYAQTNPDAGSLQQGIEREHGPSLPRMLNSKQRLEPAAMQPLTGTTLTVKAFQFSGNTLLSAEQLTPMLAGFLGRVLDFTELQQAAVVVAEAYRTAGWIVRVYLPQQEIRGGIVTLRIVEAVFGGARFDGAKPGRIAPSRLIAGIEAGQAKGAPLSVGAIGRALLLADDLPGVAVSGSLAEGRYDNATDLVLTVTDEPWLNGEISADNNGERATGRERLSGNFNLNSPLKMGEQLSANLIHSRGINYGRIALTLPAGYAGWWVGANASTLNYRLILPEFSALDAHGTSSKVGLGASYPLIRSRLENLYLGLNYDTKRFDNQSGSTTTTYYQIDAFSASLTGMLFDSFGGGGINSASLTLVQGKTDLDGSPNQAADAATTQVAGNFTKLRYATSRHQKLTDVLSLYGSFSGQVASKNLDSAEKFYLGGSSSVRAYPSSEGDGANGQLASIELRARLPQNFTFSVFYDWGHVTVNRNNDFIGASPLNSYIFQGAGLSAAWFASFGLNLKATWARRIGNNPNPMATGNDQDGSLIKNRLWLSASLSL